jgi:hypothetical protein
LANSVSPVSGAVRSSMSRRRAVRVVAMASAISVVAAVNPPAPSISWTNAHAASASRSV